MEAREGFSPNVPKHSQAEREPFVRTLLFYHPFQGGVKAR